MKTVFGEMKYSIGWKTERTIQLFDTEYHITVKIQAYEKELELPAEQLESCKMFVDNEKKMLSSIEKLMFDFSTNYKERFIPQVLLIKINGSVALLCDDEEYPDEGIAVCVYPEKCVLSQDEYL